MRWPKFVLSFSTVLVTACAAASNPEVDAEAEERAIRQRSADVVAAENAHDFAKAVSFFTSDAIAQPAGMKQAQGHEAIRASYEEFGKTGYTSLQSTPTTVSVSASGDLAWEAGENHITFPTPNGSFVDVGKYLVVWKKVDGEWYIAALAVSSDAPPPSASN